MQEVVVQKYCDVDWNAEQRKVMSAYSGRITIDGSQWDVDLCSDHCQLLVELMKMLSDYARPVTKPQQQNRKPKSRTVPPVKGMEVPDACPICGKVVANRANFFSHFRGQHGMVYGQWWLEHHPEEATDGGKIKITV